MWMWMVFVPVMAGAFRLGEVSRAGGVVRRGPPPLHFLSPAMSGMIAKTLNGAEYEAIVTETMRKESCSREEAEERYNTFLFDPTGYSLMKMQDQIEEKGYSNFQELFIAENGQEAWDERQRQIEEGQKQRQMNSIIIVSVLFCVFVAVQQYIV